MHSQIDTQTTTRKTVLVLGRLQQACHLYEDARVDRWTVEGERLGVNMTCNSTHLIYLLYHVVTDLNRSSLR